MDNVMWEHLQISMNRVDFPNNFHFYNQFQPITAEIPIKSLLHDFMT